MYQMNLTKFIKLSLHSDVTWPATLRLEVSLHETTSGSNKNNNTRMRHRETHQIILYHIMLCSWNYILQSPKHVFQCGTFPKWVNNKVLTYQHHYASNKDRIEQWNIICYTHNIIVTDEVSPDKTRESIPVNVWNNN